LTRGILLKAITVLLLLTVGIFLVHTYWADIVPTLEEILRILKETRIRYVILAILSYLLSVYLFAVRWQKVLHCIGYNLSSTSLVPVFFGAVFINNVTPGGTMAGGESFRILWANKRFGISYTNAFKTIFFERLIEAIPVVFLLVFILYLFPALEFKSLPLINNLTLKSINLLLLAFLLVGITIWYFRSKLASLLNNAQNDWKMFKKSFVPILFLSCGVWALDITRLKLVALALNIDFSLNMIITISVLSLLLGALSLTPRGFGIVEGGLVSLLLYSGLSFVSAGSFVFLERFVSYGLSSVIGFLYLSYYGGFKIWEKSKNKNFTDND
jgi:glycosyltransferase 2 family protein